MNIVTRAIPPFVIITSLLAGCSEPQREAAPEISAAQRTQVVDLATSVVAPFKKQLSETLTAAMSQGGPVAAIEVCSRDARRLAEQASTSTVSVGRSALKLRNLDNAARPWLQPVLQELAALPSPDSAARVVRIDGQRFGYAEAITLKPMCATCHGVDLAPDVAAKIRERYPDDQATGFQPGQLRGAFWAELTLAKQ